MKKLLKKLSVMRLEERVLFDAAAAAAAAEAEQQAQQSEELQQQQQQLQEQLAEEAEQQAQQQAEQQAAAEAQQAAGAESGAETEAGGDGEAAAPQDAAAANGGESANAGSEVSAAVEAIAADEGIEVEESTDVLENDTDGMVGENAADVIAVDVEAEAEESSADLEAAAEAEADGKEEIVMTTEEVAAAIAEGTRHELVIVSSSVKDSKVIIDNLAEGTEVLVLEKGVDVLDQINEYLDSTAVKYDAIHVVSHGGDGYLVLNNSVIDMESLQADPASWAAIGEHVAEDGDIMLYGCNVAQTENGKAFANQLASLTGADIAASVDVTGGDYGWELEYVTNAIATPVLSFDGYNARLASLTLVEQDSPGTGAESRNWNIQLGTAGTYYGFATGTILTNSDGTTVNSAVGQLYSVTVTEKAGEGGAPPTYEYKYTVESDTGNAQYVLDQAAASEGADSIAILKGNVDGSADLGNVSSAVNDGGLTISGASQIDITLSVSGTLNGSLSVETAQSVSVGGTVNLGAEGSLSISNITAATGNAVTTGAITGGEGASVSFSNISAATGNAVTTGAITGGEGVSVSFSNISAAGNAVNVGGAINVANAEFTDISADTGKAVNVTGSLSAETISFSGISTKTGSHAIHLNVLTVNGNGNAAFDDISGKVEVGTLDLVKSSVTITGSGTNPITELTFGNVDLSEGASLAINGAVGDIQFGNVDISELSSFSIDAQLNGEELGETDVRFTGYVNVLLNSTFTVDIAGNAVRGDGFEANFAVNGNFTVSGGSTADINVKDIYGFTTDADYHLTRRHNWQTETGFNAATFNPFTWTGNNDSLVIFGGDVVVNRDQSDVHSSMTVDGAILMYVGGNVTVGNTSGVTGSLEMTDFANLYINGNFTLNGAGEDGAPGSSATFRAIDRHPYEGYIGAYGELYRVELNGDATFVKGTTLTIDNVMFEVNTNNTAGRTFTHEGVINGSNSELVIRRGVTLVGTGFEGGEVYLDSVRYENGLTALNRGSIYWGEYGNLGVYLAENAENYTINVDLFQSVTINNLTFINRDNDAVSFVGSNANVEMSGQFKDYQPTIDFEVGSKVNVIYNSTSQQYVLSGNYYELTVTNTAEKILAGSITVGVSAPQLKHLEGLYDRSYAQELKILARKMDHLYRGGISLGTTLNTQGNTVDFYGYTYSVTPKAMIETGDSTAATNLVSYHVAQSLVDFGAAWGFLGLNANDHATGGVGFDENGNPLDGNLRDDQASRAFFGGTYQNLTIDTMPTLPVFSGVTLLPQDNITFNVDVDATVKGVFAVSSLKEGSDTKHHHLQVNVDSTMTFNNTAINLSDASLHFNGSVLGDISKITADRDNTFGNSGELQLIFESDLAKIGSISTDGIALTFNGDVERVTTIDAYGWFDNAKYTKLTFNGDVEIAKSIETHMEYDIHKAILTFNGETTGSATVDSFRGEFYFNYDGDQEIFQGTYDDFHISGTGIKTVVDDVVVKGIFNGNETKITINKGVSFELSTLYQNAADDPHRPEFTVLSGATLQFGNANTLGMDFYGTIISSGNIEIFGKSNYYGTITLEDSGSMIVDKSADGSIFAEVINKGSGLKIERAITIAQLHNYGTMTISNNDVKLDVYNHNGANLVFDLKYGTAVGGAYSFDFDKGEGTVNWMAGEAYTNGAEVIDGNMYVAANGNVPANIRPGVEYWNKIEAFDDDPLKTYKIGDVVYNTDGGVTTVYRAVDSYVPGNSDLNNTDYWEVVGTAEAYAAGSAYNTGDIVSQGGNIYTAMTAVAAGTDPSVTYWTPVANTANRLINGGTITVNNGTLNLNNFTQGDKNAETGKWTYGHNEPIDEENFVFVYDEHFVVGQHGTLVFGATAAEVNTGNSDSPKMDSYLGTITNAGTVKVGDIGDIAFANDITNEGIKSKFILSNTGTTTFNGNFTHEGSLTTDAASNIVFGTNSVVSGSGTIGGVTGYNGTVDYSGSEQHIFTGIYNNDVTLATGIKTVAGEVIFNDSVNNAAVISGTAGSVQFEGDTTGAGSFAGSLDVSYDTDSATVYSGSYGDLVINSTDRTIAADLTAENLTLNGTNTFNGDLVVNGEILLGETSTTTFGEFSSLNADTDAAAVIKGGKNGGTLTFSTNALGENVTVYADGLNAAVTYNYNGADAQRILSGTYLSGMILGNSQKIISSEVAVTGELRAWASAPLVVEDGGTLKVVGKIVAPALRVDFGAALSLTLEKDSRLGTADDFVTTDDITGKITAASDTGVILGGKINLNSTNGSTLTVYGWQDVGALGEINVNGGIIKFAGTPDVYGYVNATLVNNTGSAGSVVDDGGRLNNIWVTIFNDAFTSELTGFANDSKFRVVNGATLTVDHFALWNDTNGNGSKDDGEEWIISNVVEAFSIQEGSTLIFDLTGGFYDLNAKTITVHDLNVENGGQVIVRESNTVTVDHYAEIEGTITGQGNVNMESGTFSGYGTFDMTGGQVTYGSGVHVFSGNYNDLVLAANKLSGNIVVNGSAALDGIMTGNAKVTFNGETSGNATFGDIATDKTYTGAVTYGVAAQNIFGGQYSNIIIAGGAEDEHTVNSSLTVNVPDGGSFNLSSKLNLADGVQLTINGLTDAAAEGNTGSINALDNTSNVVYGYNAAIYGGSYANLTANGTEYTLAKNVTVNGTADLTGTFLGSVDVTFNGDTTGSALFGVIGDDTRIFGGTVAYNAASANVYGGNYRNLSVAGNGDHTINASLAVNTVANLSGKLTGTGDVTFAQGATLSGSALFGADGADYQGTVTYNGVAAIYGGYYTNLNFANGNTVSSAVSASGLVNLSGVLNVTETASVTFSGTTDANAGGNDGYINAANGSKFTYGADAAVYSGTYGDLTINGDHNLLSNYIEALGTNQGITVNGAATLDGTMTGNAKVTFNGETSGNATFGDIATDKTYTGAVTYGVAAQNIFGGQYSNIIIASGAEDEHTVTSDLKINIPDGGTFNLSSVLNLEANVELTINGLTDANAEGNTGSINGDATSSVVYGYNAAIYGGTYGNLTANGTEYTLMKDFSVNGTADLNGTFLGSVNVTFNGDTTGSALFGIVGDENSIFGGTVTFGENASTVYGGNYYGLALLGSHVLSANLAVNNSANITGTLTGTANVTFAQGTAITGGGAFGKAADDRYQGTVSYNGVTGVLNGFYSNLILANGNTTSGAIDVDNVQLSGVLTVNGTGSVNFAGTTDANAEGNTGSIAAEETTSITYADSADIYGGTYGALTFGGNRVLVHNMTVTGLATIDGTMTGSANVAFTGDTAGTALFGTDTDTYTGAVAFGANANVIYGGFYTTLAITGDHTLDRDITVVSGGTAALSGTMSGTANVTFNGSTAGDATFGKSETDAYTGKVTFNTEATAVYGGFYSDLVINGDKVLDLDLTVVSGGNAALSGNMTGTANVAFKGNTEGDATFGTDETAFAGSVYFGSEATVVYGGHYNTLTIDGAHNLYDHITVDGVATVNDEQTLTGPVEINFYGTTSGNASFEDADDGMLSTVRYGADAAVFGGSYGNLTITGAHTLTNDFSVAGTSTIDSVMSGSANVTFNKFAVTTGSGTFGAEGAAYAGVVTYEAGVALYNGTYSQLILEGERTITDRTVTVTQSATFNGKQTLEGNTTLTLSGTNDGLEAEIAGADTTTVIYNGAADQGVYTGSYGNLTIEGDHTLNNEIAVNKLATIEGVMSGSVNVTFKGETAGSGTFGTDAENRFDGVVTYSGGSNIFGGFYGGTENAAGLIIDNNGTIQSGVDVDAASVQLTGTLTVNGKILFSGYTDALAKGENAQVAGNGTVGYVGTADIYGGEYNSLEIYGDRVFAADLTVRGTTTVYDNEDGSDARLTAKDDTVDLVFEGAVEGNGAYFGDGTNAFAGSVTYGSAEGEILTGIYNKLTVLSSNAVVGDMTVKGMLTLGDNIKLSGDGDWIIGATNAADAVATTTLNNTGKVTYNGLAAGETGWIFRGEYNDLTLEGGNYQVGTVTVDGTLTSDATGKIVFTDLALGVGKAENLNADYMYNANIYGGNYNNLGVNKIVAVANDVTVKGALTALSSSALITGSADFEVAGTLAGFDNGGRFEYEGEVIFSGAADYSVDGMAQGNIFNTLTMQGSGDLTLANSEFELLAGTGNINIGAGVTGGTVNMTAGKVTYTANADRYEDDGIYYSDIIDGTYYDLTLNQNDAVVNINGNVTVSNLFDINGHELINVGDLTIVKFDNEAGLTNAGTLIFGGEAAPDVRQVWGTVGKLDSIIRNLGTVIVNRANYTIENIYQYEDYGTITVAATAVADSAEKVVKLGVYSELNTVINLNANAELHDVDDSTTFTNRAVLNINDPTGGQFVKMHIYNLSQASINVRGGQYTFGDDVDLTNGGLVSVGEDTEVKFTDVSESVAGRPRYVNNGGTIDFSFTADSSNIKNGLLGDISNSNFGTINFNTKGVKFYGNISNSGNSYLYVNADTTFIGTVNNSHGLIQVGDGTVSVEAVFAESVRTGSLFQVMNQGRALFGSIVSVSHEFYLEKGSSALFMNEVRIFSDSDNDIDTIFHVKEGAEATFQGDVFNQNGYGFHERDGWANGVAYVTTPTDTRPIDSVIGSRDHSDSDTDKISKFIIDGNVVINGKLSNIAYAYGEANTDHQANVVINSNGNTFGAIDNRGRAARIDMNGSDNQLNGTIVNTGNLYLNGTNDYNDIVNSTSIASWSWTLNSKSAAAPGTVAKIFVNDGATGSTFQNVSNSNGATFTVVSYNATGIDLVFNGDVSNGQSAALINPAFFIINTPGSVFNGDVENYGNFLIHGAAQFNALFTNYATYLEDITMPDGKRYVGATLTVSADGTRFNRIDNRGVIGVDADTYFEGAVSNSATGTINLNVANLEFSQIDNSGHINLHNANQTVIRNLNVGTSSVIDIDKESSLHLYVVTEEYTGNYDSKNYDYANDTKLGTFIVRGDKRNGVFEDHKEAFKSDTEHGLFFENTGASQSIASRILYDTTSIESSVWFDSSSTILRYDDATWIIIGNGESLTLDVVGSTEKYKVLTGGQLTVKEAASGTRIQVRGGTVLFDNDVRAMTITGLLEVMSGNAIFDNAAGITFSKTVYNAGTTTFNAGSVLNFSAGLNNTGTINAYTDLTSSITNKGNYVVMADGIRIDNKLGNENGTLTIAANAELLHDIKGTIAVQQGASLTIDDLTAIESNLANNGTVVINNASNYLAVKGDILLGSGTFTSANTASLVFAGNVAAGTSAVFNNILNVEYAGTSENGQNIINGVYQNLILTQGTAFKIIDQGTVTVNETFTNGSSVQITATGNLILNKAVAGDGAYTNAGTFNINAATAINGTVTNSGTLNANSDVAFQSTVTNSGTLNAASNANFGTLVNSGIANANGTVGVADLQNSGAFNVNGTAFVAGSNNADGIITVNGGMVASGLDNAGTVQVNAAGTLALKDNGVLNGTVVNGGRVIAEADDAAFGANFHNTGLLDVNGDNASFAGNSNNGTITVNGAKADFKDAVNNGVVVFKNSDVMIDGFDNNGTIQIHAYDDLDLSQLDNKEGFIEFHVDATITEDITEGGISVGGGHTLTLNMDEVKGNYLVSDGTLVIEAQSADSVTIDADMNVNKGSLVVNNDAVFNKDVYISDLGTLQSNGDAAFNGVVNNNGTAQINGDALFSNPVVNAGTLQVNGSADFSNSVDNSGTFQFNSDAIFNNAVNNNGTINGSDNAAVTFKGATNGSGTVNGNAVYQAYGANIYGGNYNSLILLNGGNLNADANVGAMDLNGTLATGSGSSLVINGATSGSGVITAQGSVVYNGNGSVQSIYAGSYNDIAIGPDAVGNIDTNGDIIISGNAFDQSANAQIAVDSGKVTYNGTGEQHVMAGTYDELIMAGSGTKLMEAAVFNVDSFVSDGGSYGNMIALVSASAPEMWTLNANSTTINYSYIDNAASTHGIYLNGTNMTGNGNSGSWALFNGVGGVGDSFPSINNPNFQAIAPYMSDLHYGWAATDRFDIFRRMPVDRAPIAVGEMSELVVLNNFENYDMINFDGEFFGNDGIGLLDDEAREVLDDAVSAGASDLKALLED